MKKGQGLASHQYLRVVLHDGALGEVPVGQVVAGVAQHGNLGKQAGHQVHPALVNKDATLKGDDAVAPQFALPPLQKGLHVGTTAQGTKAQVVGAGAPNVEFAGCQGVVNRGKQVRGEHHLGTRVKQCKDLAQGAVQHDVGIDVEHVLIAALQQGCNGPRLGGGVEFEDVVLKQEVIAIG